MEKAFLSEKFWCRPYNRSAMFYRRGEQVLQVFFWSLTLEHTQILMSTRTRPTLLKALCCCFHQVVPSSDPLICWRNPQNPFCVWFHWWFNPSVDYTIDKPLKIVKISNATLICLIQPNQSIKPLKIIKPSSINPPIPHLLSGSAGSAVPSPDLYGDQGACIHAKPSRHDLIIGSCFRKETSNFFIVLGFRKLRWSVIFARIETIQWKTSNVYRLGLSDSAPCREVFAALPGSMPYHFCCRDWTTTSSWLSSVWPLAC